MRRKKIKLFKILNDATYEKIKLATAVACIISAAGVAYWAIYSAIMIAIGG